MRRLEAVFKTWHQCQANKVRARIDTIGNPSKITAGKYRNIFLLQKLACKFSIRYRRFRPQIEPGIGNGARQMARDEWHNRLKFFRVPTPVILHMGLIVPSCDTRRLYRRIHGATVVSAIE